MGDRNGRGRCGSVVVAVAAAALAICPAAALAHIERAAYWPDPRPDRHVHPAAGGKVPKARSLFSAFDRSEPGRTLVVCRRHSLARVRSSIKVSETKGFRLRPTQPRRTLSERRAHHLLGLNRRFARSCDYGSIQKAVFAAHNNDFIAVMPGVYRERHSRRQPTFDPRCQKYLSDTDFGGGGAIGLSYRYQWHCPNDQALINVLGRKPAGPPPPPREDRHGIPDLGPCVRCNLQIQGTGPRPGDVVIDSGRVRAGNFGPSGVGSKKDVALKADRADGFVLKNVTVRHAAEHDVYVLETDGYLLERDKFFYAGEYGALMFASDHGLTRNCDGAGNGDSAVYPGGAPETDDDTAPNAPDARDTSFYPRARLNQKITHCDLHHNNMATSGTMGNAVHIVHNNIYGNTAGLVTDSFFAGGHPGFPQSGTVFEKNRIYSNNFDDYHYRPGYPRRKRVKSSTGVPIGVGVLIAGGNDDVVRDNKIWNNWRRGAMLLSVPDAISCTPGTQTCTVSNPTSDSFDNRFYDNRLGTGPGGHHKPNGVDFWWDEFPTTTGNCWFNNRGPDGSNSSWTGDPQRSPLGPNRSDPGFLPENCSGPGNMGLGDEAKEAMLVVCAEAAIGDPSCEWYTKPPRPGSKAAGRYRTALDARAERLAAERGLTGPVCELVGSTESCAGYEERP